MKLATWNVNSVRARKDRLLAFLDRHRPDIVCLQETKITDDAYPHDELAALGYKSAIHGQKAYNGVAVVTRADVATESVFRGMGDADLDAEARLLGVSVAGMTVISAYFPNGGSPTSARYPYKLAWMTALRRFLDRRFSADDAVVVAGDFNVAPDDLDVARPEEWAGTVLCRAEVRAALEEIRAFGLEDLVRMHHPRGGLYSWWDYRMLGFPKNNGLRIDHVFATRSVAARCIAAGVDRDERKGKLPSDHAPVLVDLADPV